MRPPRVERPAGWFGRGRAWILPTAALALAPKCFACALAYTGLAAALGFGGPEICGASPNFPTAGTTGLFALGVATFLAGTRARLRRSRA